MAKPATEVLVNSKTVVLKPDIDKTTFSVSCYNDCVSSCWRRRCHYPWPFRDSYPLATKHSHESERH